MQRQRQITLPPLSIERLKSKIIIYGLLFSGQYLTSTIVLPYVLDLILFKLHSYLERLPVLGVEVLHPTYDGLTQHLLVEYTVLRHTHVIMLFNKL